MSRPSRGETPAGCTRSRVAGDPKREPGLPANTEGHAGFRSLTRRVSMCRPVNHQGLSTEGIAMRRSHCRPPILTAVILFGCVSALVADDRVTTADATDGQQRPSLIQRVSHALFQTGSGSGGSGIVQYGMFSPYYSLWQSPDLYLDDMRCRPTPWAPRGYGWPKKSACTRLDYNPYVVQARTSVHGPAVWPQIYRNPCCSCCGQAGQCGACGGSGDAPHQP